MNTSGRDLDWHVGLLDDAANIDVVAALEAVRVRSDVRQLLDQAREQAQGARATFNQLVGSEFLRLPADELTSR